MPYGSKMKKLNPCDDALVLSLLAAHAPLPHAVLDAGCGRGERLAALTAAMPEARLFGVELEEENAALARRACPEAEICTGDIAQLPYEDAAFGAVLCECTLSLTDDPEAVLTEQRRVLCPGGVLLLGDLCAEGSDRPEELGCGTVRKLFSRGWLETVLVHAGFRILERRDCREDLLQLAAQMVFDGSFCSCVDAGTAEALRRHRTGYDMWVLKREAER